MNNKKESIETSKDWMKITSLEAACKKNGTTPEEVLPFKNPITPKQIALNAIASLWEIIQAVNEGWNDNEFEKLRRYPVFRKTKAGLVFSDACYESWVSDSDAFVGSPFAIESDEKVEFMGKQHIDLYTQYLTLKQNAGTIIGK